MPGNEYDSPTIEMFPDDDPDETFLPLATEEYQHITPEDLRRMAQEQIDEETDELSSRAQAAANLLLAGSYDAYIRTYASIGEDAPGLLGECEAQIGLAHFLMGDYQQSIVHFERAKALGSEAGDLDARIAYAQAARRQLSTQSKVIAGVLVAMVVGLLVWLVVAPIVL